MIYLRDSNQIKSVENFCQKIPEPSSLFTKDKRNKMKSQRKVKVSYYYMHSFLQLF